MLLSTAGWTWLEDFLKRATKLNVEDGVDDRIEETVHVSEPDKEREQARVDGTDSTGFFQIVSNADSVDDVDCEEWDPTEQENTWNTHND